MVVSLAVPVKAGAALLDTDGGEFNVTVGADVLTVNVTGSLVPGEFPSELGCVAVAVYVPLGRAAFALPEVQLPLVGVAVADEMGDPVALAPA